MNKELYQLLITETMKECSNTLTSKANEYTSQDDMFHNFVVAGVLQGQTKEQALRGMMAKHLVSINDMIDDVPKYSREQWQEKIGDAINYLLILSAMVKEGNLYKINL